MKYMKESNAKQEQRYEKQDEPESKRRQKQLEPGIASVELENSLYFLSITKKVDDIIENYIRPVNKQERDR